MTAKVLQKGAVFVVDVISEAAVRRISHLTDHALLQRFWPASRSFVPKFVPKSRGQKVVSRPY